MKRNYHISIRDRMWFKRQYPCPGFVKDPRNSKHKFDRWHKRPQASWNLYWRMRPELYAIVVNSYKRT